jgi:trimethylamine:corrinoid methyltransferase-like protein
MPAAGVEGTRARIPAALVDAALQGAPRLFDRATHDRWAAAGASTLKERVVARVQELRDEPSAFALEQTIRDRLPAALAEAEGSGR